MTADGLGSGTGAGPDGIDEKAPDGAPDAPEPDAPAAGAIAAGAAATTRSGPRGRGKGKGTRRRGKLPKWTARTIAIVGLVLIAALVAWLIWGRGSGNQATYQTATATTGNLTVTVGASGSAVVGLSSTIVPPVSGTVEDVQATLGEVVGKGEVLFTLKNDQLDSALTQAKASYRQAQQQRSSAYLSLMQAEDELEKTEAGTSQATRNPDGTTTTSTVAPTEDELEIARQKVTVAERGVTAAKASLANAELGLAQAKTNYAARVVRSTMNGTLTTFNVTEGLAFGSSSSSSGSSGGSSSSGSSGSSSSGSTSSGSSSSGSVVVSNLNSMKAQVNVNEADLPSIKVGQQATVTFDSISGLTITGVVSQIAPQGTSSSGVVTYLVDIALDLQNPKLRPGMTCSADIVTQQVKDAVLVANTAVKSDTQGSYVQVVTMGKDGQPIGQPARQDVTVGVADDTNTQILSGLKAGQTVVTSSSSSTSNSSGSQRGGGFGVFGGGRPPGN